MSAPELIIDVERLDDMPLLYGFVEKMGIQSAIDTVIKPHGNWEGLSMGWVVAIWLIHIISVYTHRMDRVQAWVAKYLTFLRQLTGQEVTELDFTGDRLAICLRELHKAKHWHRLEALFGHLAGNAFCQLTPLTAVQQRILSLLGLPITLYTNLAVA